MKSRSGELFEFVHTSVPSPSSLYNRRKLGEEVASSMEAPNSADKLPTEAFLKITELYRQASTSLKSFRPAATPVAEGKSGGRRGHGAGGGGGGRGGT